MMLADSFMKIFHVHAVGFDRHKRLEILLDFTYEAFSFVIIKRQDTCNGYCH